MHKDFKVWLYITLKQLFFINLKMNFIQLINIYIYYSNHYAPAFSRGPIRRNCSLTFNPFNLVLDCIFTKNND